MEKSNAKRFIDAYNKIDYSLRVQHDFKRSMSFSDMIRKAVVLNHIPVILSAAWYKSPALNETLSRQ